MKLGSLRLRLVAGGIIAILLALTIAGTGACAVVRTSRYSHHG